MLFIDIFDCEGNTKGGKTRENVENLFKSYVLEVEVKSGLMRKK